MVTLATVKEQLLYEIGDPANYLSPDVTVSFLSLVLDSDGKNRISVKGAKGSAAPPTYKVSATYTDGYKVEGTLVIYGLHARQKALRCGEVILERVKQAGYDLAHSTIECIGTGDVVPRISSHRDAGTINECLMRVCAVDSKMESLEYLAKQIAPMVTCGPPGTTGYTGGRPPIRQVFGYWPCLASVKTVVQHVEILT
jgi:hypothetical protein